MRGGGLFKEIATAHRTGAERRTQYRSGEAPTILTVACSPRACEADARLGLMSVVCGSLGSSPPAPCPCSAVCGGGGSLVMGAGTELCASDALGTASARPCASAGRLNAVRAAVKPLETLCNVPICSGSYSYVMLI